MLGLIEAAESIATRVNHFASMTTPQGTRQELLHKKLGAFLLMFVCLFVFQDRVSLYNSSSYLGTHSVDQAGLELTETYLPLPPKC